MALQKDIQVRVITPERQVLNEKADSVVIPAHDGELGVLGNRAPLMCELGIGELRYRGCGSGGRVFVDGGFAQVNENVVTVLTPRAIAAEDVSAEIVAEARAGADREPLGAGRTAARRRVRVLQGLQKKN